MNCETEERCIVDLGEEVAVKTRRRGDDDSQNAEMFICLLLS